MGDLVTGDAVGDVVGDPVTGEVVGKLVGVFVGDTVGTAVGSAPDPLPLPRSSISSLSLSRRVRNTSGSKSARGSGSAPDTVPVYVWGGGESIQRFTGGIR